MNLNNTHGLEMTEMGEFDGFKPTLFKLLSALRFSSWSLPPPHVPQPNWTPKSPLWYRTPTSCRLCAKTPASDQSLWFISSSSSSGTEQPSLPRTWQPVGSVIKVWVSPGNSRRRNCSFNSSLPFHSWQKIKLKTNTNRLWFYKF